MPSEVRITAKIKQEFATTDKSKNEKKSPVKKAAAQTSSKDYSAEPKTGPRINVAIDLTRKTSE